MKLRKITLFSVPPFYISYDGKNDDYYDFIVSEFDEKRGRYGFKRLTMKEKVKIRKQFIREYNLKVEFLSNITLELYKQGRTSSWLMRACESSGNQFPENMTMLMFRRRLNLEVEMDETLKQLIKALLKFYD